MTGGPNNFAAEVTYPPTQAPNTYVKYNYKDTVNVEWTSWAENSTITTMQIWWWDSTMNGQGWAPLAKDTVPQNGTKSYTLSNPKSQGNGVGWYLGQWNLNFTRADKNPAKGLTLSQTFNCTFDDSIDPRTFSKSVNTPATTKAPSSKSTSTAASQPSSVSADLPVSFVTITPSSTPEPTAAGAAAASSTSSATASAVPSAGLSGGAIAGVIIGVLLALALGAVGAFLLWKRQHGKKEAAAASGAAAGGGFPPQQQQPPPPQYTQYPGQYPPYNQGYNQGYNPGYAQPGGTLPGAAATYGSDYKQPLPPAPVHAGELHGSEYYNKQQPMPPASGHAGYSELPGHTRQGSNTFRQELPG